MRRRCGMTGERFRIADIDEPLEQFQRIVEALARFEAACHAESKERCATAAEIFLCQRVVRIIGKAEILYPLDARMTRKKFGNAIGIVEMALHPQRQSLGSLKQKERGERRKH